MSKRNTPKILLITALFAISALALTACGGTNTLPMGDESPRTEDVSERVASENTSGAVDVYVTVSEFSFQSSITTFEVGVPYRFIVTNEGMMAHELMIIPKLDESVTGIVAGSGSMMGSGNDNSGMGIGSMMGAGNTNMEAIDEFALAMVEDDELYPGATVIFEYTFAESADFGELEFSCYLPGHYESGMVLPITVQ